MDIGRQCAHTGVWTLQTERHVVSEGSSFLLWITGQKRLSIGIPMFRQTRFKTVKRLKVGIPTFRQTTETFSRITRHGIRCRQWQPGRQWLKKEARKTMTGNDGQDIGVLGWKGRIISYEVLKIQVQLTGSEGRLWGFVRIFIFGRWGRRGDFRKMRGQKWGRRGDFRFGVFLVNPILLKVFSIYTVIITRFT